jgi:hypothetical protein
VLFLSDMDTDKMHEFICQSLNAEVRVRQSDRTVPGPVSCSADVLPFDFTLNIRPHQHDHYQKLKSAIKSQQRFDTMFRQRPGVSPLADARAWWRYAVACVTSRPNSRPWEDIQVITRNRRRYIELVVKKNSSKKSVEGHGFHAGLSDKESTELLALEDLLPIEALDAFHLLALRQVYESQKSNEPPSDGLSSSLGSGELGTASGGSGTPKSNRKGRFPRLLRSSTSSARKRRTYSELDDDRSSAPVARAGSERESLTLEESAGAPITLFEAMTLRFGRKPWYTDYKLHDATLNLVFLGGASGDKPLALAVLRASGGARSFGRGKKDFFLDITQCDLFHRGDKVLYIKAPDDDQILEDDEWESDASVGPDGTVASTLSGGDSVGSATPDLAAASTFLPLPPAGVVCRAAAGRNMGTIKVSFSAHPATLVWTTALFDSLSEFFGSQSSEEQGDLAQHIRNAATPLARKAQLALLSPASMSLHINISAPKIWVPIASYKAEGSLFLDAGTLRVACVKDEGEPDMNWDIQARDIRMNYVRGKNFSLTGDDLPLTLLPHLVDSTTKAEVCIVRPFHVLVEARNMGSTDNILLSLAENTASLNLARSISVAVSPVSLNLVDAEPIARAFGKWYQRGVLKVRRRVSNHRKSDQQTSKPDELHANDNDNAADSLAFRQNTVPRYLSVTLDLVEIALEGHSKAVSIASDERSFASQDSLHEIAPPTRTYLVEVRDISISQTRHDEVSTTRLTVGDAEISRLRDGSFFTPLKGKRDDIDLQDWILAGARERKSEASRKDGTGPDNSQGLAGGEIQAPGILRASLMHDGRAHLDEVEVDIDSVVLRVTPTTLKDCAKAFRRVVELAQLMTNAMERKVHEESRKARRRGEKGMFWWLAIL